MNRAQEQRRRGVMFAVALSAFAPAMAAAQPSQPAPPEGAWRYGLSLYLYVPSLSGTSSAPADSNGTPIGINVDNLLDTLEFTAMGAFDAHNGRWGVFTDVMYLHLSGSTHQSRDFTLGGAAPPIGTAADLDWNFKGTIWTIGGEYRVLADPAITVDALAGARWFDVRTTTGWSITADLGPVLPSGRTGSVDGKETSLDAIVGVKGRMAFGSSGRWSMPFYLDIGAGEAELTWQAATGVSYAFKWGEVSALWRYVSYEMKPGKNLTDLSFSGPMIGATWRW
jgi:hypothetical protein